MWRLLEFSKQCGENWNSPSKVEAIGIHQAIGRAIGMQQAM
jgi:hypothetical protein